MVLVRNVPIVVLAAATALALASCTGGGGAGQSPSPTGGTTTTTAAQDRVYTEDELRELVSGMTDGDGNELKLYSKDQVDQGSRIAEILMNSATVNPEECKSIATAGLLDTVENGDVAVAISESQEPRTLSAQSGREGPDAVGLIEDVRGKLGQCDRFTVQVAGQTHDVTTEELQARTDGEETFATVSTRGEGTDDMLMQVSAAQGRLLVVATKNGADLGDSDRNELEELVDRVLAKANDGATGTATRTPTDSPTGTSTRTGTPSPRATVTETVTVNPTATATATITP